MGHAVVENFFFRTIPEAFILEQFCRGSKVKLLMSSDKVVPLSARQATFGLGWLWLLVALKIAPHRKAHCQIKLSLCISMKYALFMSSVGLGAPADILNYLHKQAFVQATQLSWLMLGLPLWDRANFLFEADWSKERSSRFPDWLETSSSFTFFSWDFVAKECAWCREDWWKGYCFLLYCFCRCLCSVLCSEQSVEHWISAHDIWVFFACANATFCMEWNWHLIPCTLAGEVEFVSTPIGVPTCVIFISATTAGV